MRRRYSCEGENCVNREDIIRLAREAGAGEPESLYGRTDYVVMTWFELERFAALVSAAEREECAKLCEEMARRHDDIRRAALEVVAEWIRARKEP
jgi:hypothetical protein